MVPVRCNTTKGELRVEVFPEAWGSRGAQRFLDLMDAGLFSTKVALHRAVKVKHEMRKAPRFFFF